MEKTANNWQNMGSMRLAIIVFVLPLYAPAQTALQRQISAIAAEAHGKVSVACSLPGTTLKCDLNPQAHPPMQSVFKLPLAVAALSQGEHGRLSLDQTIRFRSSDRILPRTYSPLQEKYPEGEVDLPLREFLRMAVSVSDNVAADIVLRTVGGPKVVEGYVRSLGIRGFHLQDSEAALHHDERLQYRNWFEPAGAVQLLQRLSANSALSAEHTQLVLDWMRDTSRAPKRIKGALPAGTIVMHKPGTSDAATNDIGLITLPDGRRLAIAIFLTDCTASDEVRDSVVARIARAAYDVAIAK